MAARGAPARPGHRARRCALAVAAALACACAGSAPQAPEPADAVAQPLFLWEARHPDREGRLYLMGTVHMLRAEDVDLDPVVLAAFEAADTLAVELDLGAIATQDMQMVLAQSALLPPGTTLRDRITPETWSLLQEALARNQLPGRSVERFEPWWVALMIGEIELVRLGYDPRHGVDANLLARARGRKAIVSLETLDFQVRLLDDLPPHLQEVMLTEALLEARDDLTGVEALVDAWRSGDADALARQMADDLQAHPELRPFYERTFFERNRSMAARLHELWDGGVWFVAVGAAHLVGEEGIVSLLRERGYRVRQLESARAR